jgi:hypothetical protein
MTDKEGALMAYQRVQRSSVERLFTVLPHREADLQLVSPGAQHQLEMLAERKAALERVAELQAQLLTAVEQFGKECELKLVAMIEVRDLRKRVRGALQAVRDETDDVMFDALLRRIEEALDD